MQTNRDIYYVHLVTEHNPPVKLKTYEEADQHTSTVVRDYRNRDTDEYLREIEHSYQMNLWIFMNIKL